MMKRIVLLFIMCGALAVSAQNRSTIETQALKEGLRKSKSVQALSQRLTDKYPIRWTAEGPCIGVMAKVDGTFDAKSLESYGIKVTSRVADIVAMRVPLAQLEELDRVAGITVYSVAHKVAPTMDRTRFDTRTDSVQAGLGVPMPYKGEGVLIGITDWGFDYTHPNFSSTSSSRIYKAWDHYKLSGPAPAGFDYGTEYTTYADMKAVGGDTSGLYGYGTHGTHVAGICGGKGTGGHAVGQAPAANFLLGSWLLDEAAWMDQVAWMYRISKEEHKRLVINSSWGMYTFSTLDGTSLLSQAINSYADSGIVFVTSGGNNGDAKFHFQRRFSGDDTVMTTATYYSSGVGQALIFWGEPGGQFKAQFAMAKVNNAEQVVFSPMFETSADIPYTESYLVIGNDTMHYDVMSESSNPLCQRPHILLNVEKVNGYNIKVQFTADSGVLVHAWNVCNVENHAGNVGCDFINGDNRYGIGEPACSERTISVAAHIADRMRQDTIYNSGDLTDFSSIGPTLDGRNKPEISAPGSSVVSSVSSFADLTGYSVVHTAMSGGKIYKWVAMSGTSMSSPAVSGVVALMLEANPNLTVDQVREIIFSTARNDDKTGDLRAHDSISPSWGYGKIDAVRCVNAAYDKLSIDEAIRHAAPLTVYPNPAADQVVVMTGSNQPSQMQIFTIDGRLVQSQTIAGEAVIDLSNYSGGVYIVRVHDRSGIRTAKMVKK